MWITVIKFGIAAGLVISLVLLLTIILLRVREIQMTDIMSSEKKLWVRCPCYGTLQEIHEVLYKELELVNSPVTINGWGYTVKESGFQSNENGVIVPFERLVLLHPGTALFVGYHDLDEGIEIPEIVTSGKVPHVSKRCALCGDQLTEEEIRHGACNSCYAEETGH